MHCDISRTSCCRSFCTRSGRESGTGGTAESAGSPRSPIPGTAATRTMLLMNSRPRSDRLPRISAVYQVRQPAPTLWLTRKTVLRSGAMSVDSIRVSRMASGHRGRQGQSAFALRATADNLRLHRERRLVPGPGIEPGRPLGSRDFKSRASASSATPAYPCARVYRRSKTAHRVPRSRPPAVIQGASHRTRSE